MLGRELIAFDVGDQQSGPSDNRSVERVVHETFVREGLLATERAHAPNVFGASGQEAPAHPLSLPAGRIRRQGLRRITLGIECDGEQHQIPSKIL